MGDTLSFVDPPSKSGDPINNPISTKEIGIVKGAVTLDPPPPV